MNSNEPDFPRVELLPNELSLSNFTVSKTRWASDLSTKKVHPNTTRSCSSCCSCCERWTSDSDTQHKSSSDGAQGRVHHILLFSKGLRYHLRACVRSSSGKQDGKLVQFAYAAIVKLVVLCTTTSEFWCDLHLWQQKQFPWLRKSNLSQP